MRLVLTGRTASELIELYDTTHCRDCGKPLTYPNVALGGLPCPEHRYHRTLRCRACGTVHVDDPCTLAYDQNPLRGHGR